MFLKPFRVKSNTQLKTSDKKRLRGQLSEHFSALSTDEISELVPLKEEVSSMKLFCHKGDPSVVYVSGGIAIAFTVETRQQGPVLLPTLQLCWRYPGVPLAPIFTTHADVLPRMQQGADLMMRGVIFKGLLTQSTFGVFEAGTPAIIASEGRVIAVGTTALSSTDLYMAGGHGKGVIVAHVVGDNLWSVGNKGRPPTAPPQQVISGSISSGGIIASAPSCSGDTAAGSAPPLPFSQSADAVTVVAVANTTRAVSYASTVSGGATPQSCYSGDTSTTPSSEQYSGDSSSAVSLDNLHLEEKHRALSSKPPQVLSSFGDDMDAILLHCFLKALQRSKGSLALPLLTSNFYRLHVLPACPDDITLDVKKTSYKKLNKFLITMEERGILKITEHPKGIENITSVAYDHEDVTSFRYRKSETTARVKEGVESVFVPPTLEEVYQVSGDTIDFFRACGKCKGDVLSRSEVRDVITTYIKRKNLVDSATKMVNLEPPLHSAIIARKEGLVRQLKWDQVFSRMLGRMAPAVRIMRPGYPTVIKKGKIEPIEMTTAKRVGNKVVTLVYNVAHFGIVEVEFAKQLKRMAAASVSVEAAEHKPQGTVQVMAQGNQTAEVAKLLIDTYNIPKKYIKGLELIPKAKRNH